MNRYDKIVRNIGIVIFILMLGTSFVLGGQGEEPDPNGQNGDSNIFQEIPIQRTNVADGKELLTGQTYEMAIPEDGIVIKNLTARLSWTDETNPPDRIRLRRYENHPDSFSIRVYIPDGNSSDDRGANQIGSLGLLEIPISIDDDRLTQLYLDGKAGKGEWRIEITMESAGAWKPQIGIGLMDVQDTGNDFSLSVDYEYYDMTPDSGKE